MAKRVPTYYYRIYDDREQFSYIKSSLEERTIRRMLKSFEKKHQEYYNAEFLDYLREHDRKAELIDVVSVSY